MNNLLHYVLLFQLVLTSAGQARALGLRDTFVSATVTAVFQTEGDAEALADESADEDQPQETPQANMVLAELRGGDTFQVGEASSLTAVLVSSGLEGERADVRIAQLPRGTANAIQFGWEPLQDQSVFLGPDDAPTEVVFQVTPHERGEYIYRVRVEPVNGEQVRRIMP